MYEWQKEQYIYQLCPAPPKKDDLQEYINLYLNEKNDLYFSWFLHYYEPILNTTVIDIVQRYAMQGHFLDIKEICILGILLALNEYSIESSIPFITYKTRIMWNEVHRYIRTMRTGLTVPSDSEYKKVRKAMRIYNACKKQKNPDALIKISKAIGVKEDIASQILQGAVRNQQFIDFYRQYADDDGEESQEEVYGDEIYEPLHALIQKEQRETLFSAYNSLNYKEQEVIRMHLGFCPECHSTKGLKFQPQTFFEVAINIGLSSAKSAEKIYRSGITKIRDRLLHNSTANMCIIDIGRA